MSEANKQGKKRKKSYDVFAKEKNFRNAVAL
jgi:hypothetical protein